MIFLQIFICLAALYVFLMHPRIRRADSSPFLGAFFAHRGLHDNNHQIPENSLAAFQRAVDAGYGIELDVQLSADRIPVVFHDATLSRMCGIDRRVDELTFAELRQLSLGNTKEQIPSFQEALAFVNGKVPLLVELCHHNSYKLLPYLFQPLQRAQPHPPHDLYKKETKVFLL